MMEKADIDQKTLYLIYDDECPLCRSSAHALNIKKAVGDLVLINAREAHPLVQSAYARGYDPDHGIVVIYNDQYYYAADAVHFLAMLDSSSGMLNRVTATLLRSHVTASMLYPVVKAIRRLLLNFKGVGSVKRNDGLPLFADVLGEHWQTLSPVLQKCYSNRPYTNDMVLINGNMTVKMTRWMRIIKPLLKLTCDIITQDGDNIPVIVKLKSEPNTAKYWFDREFCLNQPICFKSYIVKIKNNAIVEFMRFNVGWRAKCSVSGDRVVMAHDGFVFRFFNWLIPVPISLLIGKCHIVEYPVADDTFRMEAHFKHFIFGEIYQYKGEFKILEVIQG